MMLIRHNKAVERIDGTEDAPSKEQCKISKISEEEYDLLLMRLFDSFTRKMLETNCGKES